MKIIQEYPVKVYAKEYEGKKYYRIGLSKKDKNGNYINGYLDARFRKDTEVDDSKKIYIQDAWLDFYIKDKITHPFIFINKFEYVAEFVEETKLDPNKDFENEIILKDADLPF